MSAVPVLLNPVAGGILDGCRVVGITFAFEVERGWSSIIADILFIRDAGEGEIFSRHE
ncbi:hypothetical protein ACQ0MK_09170 [Thalassospira lucentensis]|uniref:hypothetical protein n=1 Tax=Thalassospira lucentensis TaxID=168935 RepID=UPI003D2EBA4B